MNCGSGASCPLILMIQVSFVKKNTFGMFFMNYQYLWPVHLLWPFLHCTVCPRSMDGGGVDWAWPSGKKPTSHQSACGVTDFFSPLLSLPNCIFRFRPKGIFRNWIAPFSYHPRRRQFQLILFFKIQFSICKSSTDTDMGILANRDASMVILKQIPSNLNPHRFEKWFW